MKLLLASVFKICMNILIVLVIGLSGSISSDRLIHARMRTYSDIRNMYFPERMSSVSYQIHFSLSQERRRARERWMEIVRNKGVQPWLGGSVGWNVVPHTTKSGGFHLWSGRVWVGPDGCFSLTFMFLSLTLPSCLIQINKNIFLGEDNKIKEANTSFPVVWILHG